MFDLRLDDVVNWIRGKRYSRIAVQLPEGLRSKATEISDRIFSGTGARVTIVGDPCYGACDLYTDYKSMADGLVHFGHSEIPSFPKDDDIFFVEAFADICIEEGITKIAASLPERIGLLATVQYVKLLPSAKRILDSLGKRTVIGKGDTRIRYDGQVLGCNCSAATAVAKDIDCFLYIGEGDFHPLAAAFGAGKEMRVFDPVTSELRSVDDAKDRILRKRFAAIERAKAADSFLVIVCTKAGQRRDAAAEDIIKKITSAGKKAYKVSMREITPESLLSYKADAYVCTACPRIAMDDSVRYARPMLTIPEAEAAIGIRTWDEYIFDEIRGE